MFSSFLQTLSLSLFCCPFLSLNPCFAVSCRGLLDDSYFIDSVKKVMKEAVPYFAQYSTRVKSSTPSEVTLEEAAEMAKGAEDVSGPVPSGEQQVSSWVSRSVSHSNP